MIGAGNYFTVRLEGGCPWGFRLQGGEGTGQSLTVSKVRRKSKAYNKLHIGDIVITCNGQPCNHLTYDEVMILADKGSPNLALYLYRPEKENRSITPEISKLISDIQSDDRYKRVREEDVSTEYRSKITKQTESFRIKPVSLLPRLPKPFLKMSSTDEISVESMDTETSQDQITKEQTPVSEEEMPEITPPKIETENKQEVLSSELTSETPVSEPEAETIALTPEDDKYCQKTVTKESVIEGNAVTEINTEITIEKNDTTEKSMVTEERQTVAPGFISETISTHVETKTEDQNSFSQTFKSSEFEQSSTGDENLWFSCNDTETSSDDMTSSVTSPVSKITTEQDQNSVGMNSVFTGVNKGKRHLNQKIYQPPKDMDMDLSLYTRRKKMFSSSSFYEEPNAIYPTVEEQVELCRKIADSLSSDKNKKSRGANMFYKRVTKSQKWIHEGPDPIGSDSDSYSEHYELSTDPTAVPYIQVSKGPPKLKLILDPRQIQDMVKLRSSGQNINEHNVISPDICLGIVKDLNSPTGKGALLFAKRKKKSEEWVVDEEKVKSHLKTEYSYESSHQKQDSSIKNQRLKMLKSPWEAAMESPIGSCDGAFVDLHPDTVAETVIRVAEEKTKTFGDNFPNKPSYIQQKSVQQATRNQPSPFKVDPYKPRAPRGWSGTTNASPLFTATTFSSQPIDIVSQPSVEVVQQLTAAPKYNFHDFNNTPKAWMGGRQMSFSFKAVKPPSLIIK